MVSFDVEVLFTNKPLVERINYIAVKYISEGNPGLKLCTAELKSLFRFATSGQTWTINLINNGDNHLGTIEFRKKTFMGPLTNFFNFTASCYKIGLIRALVDRIFRVNNTWLCSGHAYLSSGLNKK